ncbi:MAG TPA: hypothetical protein EYO90_01745, partial [Candidatus Latescibacteria bacterium]|nr:hypothetical protein [Candidatus Latescibacterota bacterium]
MTILFRPATRRSPNRAVTSSVVAAFAGVFIGVFGACSFAEAQSLTENYTPVTEAMLLSPPDGEWLMWRRNYGHWGYSPL